MQITLTRADVDSTLPSIGKGLDKYAWLQAHVRECDVRVDLEFQRRFNAFYRVRRPPGWRREFYDLLEALKAEPARFPDVLARLHRAVGRHEASFASKLVATLDPHMPVIDSVVLRNLGVRLPAPGSVDRAHRLEQLHSDMMSCFNDFLVTETGRYLVNLFRFTYPDADVTEVKMLDLVLWQFRPTVQNVR